MGQAGGTSGIRRHKQARLWLGNVVLCVVRRPRSCLWLDGHFRICAETVLSVLDGHFLICVEGDCPVCG